MSESERMPGERKRSQVPPIASRASRIVKLLSGHSRLRWHAAPTPDRPAPTIRTSTCSMPTEGPSVADRVEAADQRQQQEARHVLAVQGQDLVPASGDRDAVALRERI